MICAYAIWARIKLANWAASSLPAQGTAGLLLQRRLSAAGWDIRERYRGFCQTREEQACCTETLEGSKYRDTAQRHCTETLYRDTGG